MEKYCQNCKQKNAIEAQFCCACAAPINTASTGQEQPYQQNHQWNQPSMHILKRTYYKF
jgi:hypothetical protein